MRLTVATVILLTLTVAVHAEWKEPADGLFTDDQMTRYLGAMKDITALYKASGNAGEGQGAIGAMGLWARTNEKYQAILATHKLSDDEFTWLGGKVTEAWMHAMLQLNWEKKGRPAMADSEKKLRDQMEAHKAKLAAYEKAAKDGTKVLEPREVAAIVSQLAEEVQSAETAKRELAIEIQKHKTEITAKESAAKAADALAAKPPADVPAGEHADYIEARKADATAARQEAKDLQDVVTEKEKSIREYDATIAAARLRAKNPGAPGTDQEKADVAAENKHGIQDTKESIKVTEEALKLVQDSLSNSEKQLAEMAKETPKPNIDRLKKRYGDFCDAIGLQNEFADPKK